MIMQKKNLLPVLRDYLVITVASFIFAMAWECFMIPNGMAAGGMMGLCTIIQYATGGLIEAQYSYIVINALLIITAVLAMGIGFGFKTIYCIIVSTLAMGLLDSATFLHSVEGNFFYVQERVLIPIIAGVLEAVGIGLVLRCGGSTGGTDIIGAVINKYKNISIGRAMLFCDFFIIGSSFFLFHDVEKIVFGFVEMFISNYVLDMVLNGNRQSVQFLIFSQKYDEIAQRIIKDLDRSCTILDGTGGYSRKPVKVVVLLARKTESNAIFRLVKQIDNQAFISQANVRGVYGEGFDQIKT